MEEKMKKEIKKALCTLGLVGGLSTLAVASQKELNQKKCIENKVDTTKNNLLQKENHYSFLEIKDIGIFDGLNDFLYEGLNKKIQEEHITTLYFKNIKSTFDFSKLEVSSIENIYFENCSESLKNFNVPTSCTLLSFEDTSEAIIKEILGNNDIKNITVFIDNKKDESLISYLVEQKIELKGLYYKRLHHGDITKEELELLSQINTKILTITNDELRNALNLELNLNPTLSSLNLYFIHGNVPIESLVIQASSSCYLSLFGIDVTKNTKLSFPNQSIVYLDGIFSSPNAFYDLFNISVLNIREEKGLDFNYYSFKDDYCEALDQLEKAFGNKEGIQKEKLRSLTFQNLTQPVTLFNNKELKALSFENVSFEIAEKMLNTCHLEQLKDLTWGENIENKSNLKQLLDYLIKQEVTLENLNLNLKNEKDYKGITEEEFQLLSQIKAKNITVFSEGYEQPIHLDLTLNETISNIYLRLLNKEGTTLTDNINSELGTIKIQSLNNQLRVYLLGGNITEKTHFSFPDFASVSLFHLQCSSVSAIKELNNIEYLYLGNHTPWQGPEHTGYITYSKKEIGENEGCIAYFSDFNEMMAYLENYETLLKIRENLNVSPKEELLYVNTISIGDIINVEPDTSLNYYCVSSISLINGDAFVEVDNMEEYELYLKKGYRVYGYSVMNGQEVPQVEEEQDEKKYVRKKAMLASVPFKQ